MVNQRYRRRYPDAYVAVIGRHGEAVRGAIGVSAQLLSDLAAAGRIAPPVYVGDGSLVVYDAGSLAVIDEARGAPGGGVP